jgi:hypothetical protein
LEAPKAIGVGSTETTSITAKVASTGTKARGTTEWIVALLHWLLAVEGWRLGLLILWSWASTKPTLIELTHWLLPKVIELVEIWLLLLHTHSHLISTHLSMSHHATLRIASLHALVHSTHSSCHWDERLMLLLLLLAVASELDAVEGRILIVRRMRIGLVHLIQVLNIDRLLVYI